MTPIVSAAVHVAARVRRLVGDHAVLHSLRQTIRDSARSRARLQLGLSPGPFLCTMVLELPGSVPNRPELDLLLSRRVQSLPAPRAPLAPVPGSDQSNEVPPQTTSDSIPSRMLGGSEVELRRFLVQEPPEPWDVPAPPASSREQRSATTAHAAAVGLVRVRLDPPL
jgi:hypothetical protein